MNLLRLFCQVLPISFSAVFDSALITPHCLRQQIVGLPTTYSSSDTAEFANNSGKMFDYLSRKKMFQETVTKNGGPNGKEQEVAKITIELKLKFV